jgi:hypothetical protein
LAEVCAVVVLLGSGVATGQVITIDSRTGTVTNGTSGTAVYIDRRYTQIQPTHVELSKTELDAKTRLMLIRQMVAEEGFAMRPFPRGHKGLTLAANGDLEPAGEPYLNMVESEGMSAKPGDRLVLTDIKIEQAKIIFILNGGPDAKHRFLSHIELGPGTNTKPVIRDDGKEPEGARLTLAFATRVPELTDAEVKALLAPLISFDVKTPVQAFTDTLPLPLKEAILNHHVMVGMTTDMVLFAKGQPVNKTREMDGQMPFEEWIYGRPPQEVDFVRINGNRVIRMEVAKMGETPVIFEKDEVSGLLIVDGAAPAPGQQRTTIAKAGDVERDPDKEAPAAPPSLRKPGESLPNDPNAVAERGQKNVGVMRPVQFPKQKPDAHPDAHSAGQPDTSGPTAAQPVAGDGSEPSQQPTPPKAQNLQSASIR